MDCQIRIVALTHNVIKKQSVASAVGFLISLKSGGSLRVKLFVSVQHQDPVSGGVFKRFISCVRITIIPWERIDTCAIRLHYLYCAIREPVSTMIISSTRLFTLSRHPLMNFSSFLTIMHSESFGFAELLRARFEVFLPGFFNNSSAFC